jgi:hypothetical protein
VLQALLGQARTSRGRAAGVEQHVRTSYLPPARRNAALTGVVVGGVAVIVLTVLAVVGLRPNGTPTTAPSGPQQAPPSLRTALLAEPDLPASFTARPTPTRVRAPQRTEHCQRLVADPEELLRSLVPQSPKPPISARHVGADHGILDQAVQVVTSGGGAAALATLRKTAQSCSSFTARLDDGTKAQVKLTSTNVESLLIGEAYTVSMTLTTKAGQQSGYLAISRVGDMVSVLRCTASADADHAGLDRQIQDLVGKALDKLVVLGGSPAAQ